METIVQTVLAHGRETPDKLALALKAQQMTYGQLCSHITAAADRLQKEHGIQKGDLVMISAASNAAMIVVRVRDSNIPSLTSSLDAVKSISGHSCSSSTFLLFVVSRIITIPGDLRVSWQVFDAS